jgi:DNA polymerase-3 subunit alpha
MYRKVMQLNQVDKPFVHLHVHTQYSLLDGQASIDALIDKAQNDGMSAMAVTDHGNMFGIKEFCKKVNKKNSSYLSNITDCEWEQKLLNDNEHPTPGELERIKKLSKKIAKLKRNIFKPIIGCECYCARHGIDNKTAKDDLGGWDLVLLAKSLKGYKNLIKLVSISWTDGFYRDPRIDKALLEKYHEDLIVCSACLEGEIPQLTMNGQVAKAEESILWFKNLFGDDYYIELQRHKTNNPNADRTTYPKQVEVNKILIELAQKHSIKLMASNDVHFVNEEDAEAHDRLFCISKCKDFDDPNRMRYSQQEWLKTTAEMNAIFRDIPEALTNTMEIADKIEFYSIDSDVNIPFFPINPSFGTEEGYKKKYAEIDLIEEFEENNYIRLGGYDKVIRIKLEADYLTHLTMERVSGRYGNEIDGILRERIEFELNTVKTMGFPGYFLIVQDLIAAAREMGVSVGPGRGSAAGSVVSYCLGITDIDPIKYDLLFERFLNPDRISLPDIDIDFDADGRGKVLKWIKDKYGKEKVAHIIAFGTMAAKIAIRDIARIETLPLSDANFLVQLIPDYIPGQKSTLKNAIEYVPELKKTANSSDLKMRNTLKYAQQLEGNVRNICTHACGIIIGRQDISDIVPISTLYDKYWDDKEVRVITTQYDRSVIEETGFIIMDFLGLRYLSIIKKAIENIEQTTGITININQVNLDDKKTWELFCQGRTKDIFQCEFVGMQKFLKKLQPSGFEDLFALIALYRPESMAYIPSLIARKHGREKIAYDIPVMERYLKDTYGITVYQEQIMHLSQVLANFTRGESDTLRIAMGKKMIAQMKKLREKFVIGGESNGHTKHILKKIWNDWEKIAPYAFNKSHAVSYSWIAYQTAYLKVYYPSEYMKAVLSHR